LWSGVPVVPTCTIDQAVAPTGDQSLAVLSSKLSSLGFVASSGSPGPDPPDCTSFRKLCNHSSNTVYCGLIPAAWPVVPVGGLSVRVALAADG
jgi:hypothetical protein